MYEDVLMFCEKVMKNRVATSSVRPSEVRLLMCLSNGNGPYTPVALAQSLGVSKPMIASMLTKLIAQGLVVRIPAPEDGRSVLIMPTKKGCALIVNIQQSNQKFMDDLAEKMGKKKFEILMKSISLANAVIDV